MLPQPQKREERPRLVGRYVVYDEIAAGGMATVHFGRLLGAAGFSRTVAIKRLHPQFARDPDFVAMFVDEARLAARIRHPNVVPTLDVVATDEELFLVMEYVQGESLSRLLRGSRGNGPIPVRIASAIFCGALHGLHAAHEATDEHGMPLGLVHRDMSPQNVLVGIDGVARVLDFGVALAAGRAQTTGQGKIKGKIGYLAPEQIRGIATRQTDLFSTGVALWEVLTGKRLFQGDDPRQVLSRILSEPIVPPTVLAPHLPPGIDDIVMRALERDPDQRYATAREMAMMLESCLGVASTTQVGQWVDGVAHKALAERAAVLAAIESSSSRMGGLVVMTPDHPSSPTGASGVALSGALGAQAMIDSSPGFALQPKATANDSPTRNYLTHRRKKYPVALVGGGVAFAAVLLALCLHRAEAPPSAPAAEPSAAAVAAPTVVAPAPGPAADEAGARVDRMPDPPARSPAADRPVPSPAAAPAPAPRRPARDDFARAPRPRPAPAPVLVPSPPPAKKPPALDCDPPYSLNEQGHKIWKDECFRKQEP